MDKRAREPSQETPIKHESQQKRRHEVVMGTEYPHGYMDAGNFIKGYFYIYTTHKPKSNHYVHILLGPKDCGTDSL